MQFVYQVLFPYARQRLHQFLTQKWDSVDVEAFRAQARQDQQAGLSVPTIPEGVEQAVREAVEASALLQMDSDRKVGALKALQGQIWEYGYQQGELKGQIFEDVPDFLSACKERNIPVSIYSSGSVLAQKLLFGHSQAGDLTAWLTDYFDTAVGPKKEPDSYRHIAQRLGVEASDSVFATDILDEAVAAHRAGWKVVIMDRPGNAPQPAHDFPVLTELTSLLK